MKLSARNQFKGTVASVKEGAVNGTVVIEFGQETVKSSITMESIQDLGLKVGVEAIAVIKATHVLVAKGEKIEGISARNQFAGVVEAIKEGAVNGHVSIKLAGGEIVSASITNDAIEELGLKVGDKAVAIVKATDVMVGVE